MKAVGEKKRVLLVNPPYFRLFKKTYTHNKYPLSLGYLAVAIKKDTQWTPRVYNADFAILSETRQLRYLKGEGYREYRKNLQDLSYSVWKEVRDTIKKINPKILGIYCCASNSKSASIVASIAKTINKNITVIVGGPHPSLIKKEALLDPNIDIAVKGEGEATIVEILKTIESNQEIKNVNGLIYKENQEIKETKDREPIQDLDSIPFPSKWAKEILVDYEKHPTSAFNGILTSRGCIGNCLFCGSHAVFSRKTRFRSTENIIKEILYLRSQGISIFEIADDTFGIDDENLKEFCAQVIKHCKGIKWKCETRVDLVTEEKVKLMKKAGCTEIEIGIESGNNQVLRDIRKNITIDQALTVAKIIKKSGIAVWANFLIGLPMETKQTLADTYRAMQKIQGRLNYSIFTPYPGTEGFAYCQKHDLINENSDPSAYNHQSPENHFTPIDKKLFVAIAEEIEKYVDRRNANEDLKQLFSFASIEKLLDFGTLQDSDLFRNFTKNAITEIKLLLKNRLTPMH